MNFGELLGICFTIGGAVYGVGYLIDSKHPFSGGVVSVAFMTAGLVLYGISLKMHEYALAAEHLSFQFPNVSFT